MSRAYAHGGVFFARRPSTPAPITPPPRRPFSKPIANLQTASGSSVKTAQIIKFPSPEQSTLKPEAVDKLPPMDPVRLISRPDQGMSDAARRLFMLKWWLDECLNDRRLDADAYTTECRLREQAAHIIGFLA